MKQNTLNDKPQSRREFFKIAAKTALPIIGAAVLASTPNILNATESMSCNGSCYHSCYSGCDRTCMYTCKTTCDSTCKGTCKTSCMGSAYY